MKSDPSAPFEIRTANPGDSIGILRCLAEAFAPFHAQYTPGAYADTILAGDSITRRMAEMTLFVAESGGEIVGTIGCQSTGTEGHLRGMAVLPEWQGTAVSSTLLHTAEQYLRTNMCNRVTLDTTEPLKRAAHFYEKHGYRLSGREVNFFGMRLFEYSKSL